MMASLMGGIVMMILPKPMMAQPGFPHALEQTPIDGGLGILAALGGLMPLKIRKRIVFSDSDYFLYLH